MDIAILGTKGIGKFHAREFNSLGERVKFILGRTPEGLDYSKKLLLEKFNISVKMYKEIDLLLKEAIDAVSICVPLEFHEKFTRLCLNKNIHVFCEKPFVKTQKEAVSLFKLASKKKLILSVNMQWPHILYLLNFEKQVKTFEMSMQSGKEGLEMMEECLPHYNSMLIKLCGIGKATKFKFNKKNQTSINLSFEYLSKKNSCKVTYHFSFNPNTPRELSFKINDKKFVREVDSQYNQFLVCKLEKIKIEDPLKVSIKNFIDSIKGTNSPFFTEKEIVSNISLQNKILNLAKKEKIF